MYCIVIVLYLMFLDPTKGGVKRGGREGGGGGWVGVCGDWAAAPPIFRGPQK